MTQRVLGITRNITWITWNPYHWESILKLDRDNIYLYIIFTEAKKEEESYKKYKESKKLGHVSYVGTAGIYGTHLKIIWYRLENDY